jgi:hypothetical protein
MGLLDESGLETLVSAGCPRCRSPRLMFRSYLDGQLPVAGGEPVGRLAWIYDGEKFVDGVFEVACAACGAVIFAADICPRCHAPGGLRRALETPNRWPVPAGCPACGGEEILYAAFVPARVASDGGRAEKARTSTEMHEDGFHGYRVDCRDCGIVAELSDACPLCEAPAPLRARPG